MIQFTKQPQRTLNATTGMTTGFPPKIQPKNIGMDTQEFHNQVMTLAEKKTPIEKVYRAIDVHPHITDKATAKKMAESIYSILEK